jgi:hypothetical protein
MKFTFPCMNARMARRGPSGISRSAFSAPANGGTSGQRLLTVPALGSPVSDSANRRQESATAVIRDNARRVVSNE